MALTEKRLTEVYRDSRRIPFNQSSKFILMSDCHRGQGNEGDNFLPNQNVFYGALSYYYQNGFTYTELGDGDELWENRRIKPIIDVHSDAFWLMKNFYNKNRLIMLYGNHDIVKRQRKFTDKNCKSYYCSCEKKEIPLFPEIKMEEGLVLQSIETGQELFLVHGHQGDLLNDIFWPLARFLVRHVWRTLELIGILDPTGAGRAYWKKEKIEKKLADFARKNGVILIAGHTHRPVFAIPGQTPYFNDGSCVHPRCITGIEIENHKLTLVKWSVCTRADRSLYVGREVLEGPVAIEAYQTGRKY